MGFNIYLKAYKNLDGRAKPFYRVTSKEGSIKKYIDVLVDPKDFDKKKYRVKATADNAKTINEKLLKTTNLLSKGWGLYESGNYTWEELVSYLGGTKTNMDLLHFCETIIKPKATPQLYSGVMDAFGAARKVLGRDITFKDLNEDTFDKIIKNWKSRLRSATVKTYKYHLGIIANEAYKKRLIEYKYVALDKWRKQADLRNKDGSRTVRTATPQDFLKGIKNCKNLMHIEGLGFWLLCYGLRGLYPTDLCSIHESRYDIYLDTNEVLYKHDRHKTGIPMDIFVMYPFNELIRKLRGYLELTHGYQINVKTGKKYLRTGEYELSDKNQKDGWFFKEYKKHTWGTISKNAVKVGFQPLKTARKTFNTVALAQSVSQEIRNELLGHKVQGVQVSYEDWEYKKLQKKVYKAHTKILAHFNVDKLYPALIQKADEILEKMGIPPKAFNNKWSC